MTKFILFLLVFGIGTSVLSAQQLATLKVRATLSEDQGRSVVNARNHHFVIDSPPPLGGPNEAINPIEVLLSALGSCAVLVSEKVSAELDIPLTGALAEVSGDLDPRGVKGEAVNPRLQVFRVKLNLQGPTTEQAEQLVSAIRTRCPVYTTLERSAPIELDLQLGN